MEPQVTGTMTADQIEAMIQRTVRQVTEENEQRHQQETQGLRQSIDELRAKLDQMPASSTIRTMIDAALENYANRSDTQKMIDAALETWREKIREHLETAASTQRGMQATFERTMESFNQMIGRMDNIKEVIDSRNEEIKSLHDDIRGVKDEQKRIDTDLGDQRHRGESITQLIIGPDGVKTLVTARLIPAMDAIQKYQDEQKREAERRRKQWQAIIKVGRVVADRAAKYPGTWQVIGFGMGALGIAAGGGLGLEGIRQLLTALRHLLLGS